MDMMVILTRDQNGNVGIFYGTEELSLPMGGRKQQEEVQTTRDESWLVLNLVPLGPAGAFEILSIEWGNLTVKTLPLL